MSGKSIIYQNIHLYRLLMSLLYLGGYKKRFKPVIEHLAKLEPKSKVLELCFADTHLAEYCKQKNLTWQGFDINENFIDTARQKGFDAMYRDLAENTPLPEADVVIMLGSFYHFNKIGNEILTRMFEATDCVILSEPVKNLSDAPGLIGFFARRSANAGKGFETFRYNRETFLNFIEENRDKLSFVLSDVKEQGKDLIVKLNKR